MDFPKTRAFMTHLTSWRIPGNTIVIYHRGKRIFSFSSGYSDLEEGRLMTGDEYFNIYSCTKVATVTAALQLLEKGYFTLSTPLYDFFPAFRHMRVKRTDGTLSDAASPITLWNLFTMTAGFNYAWQGEAVQRARALTEGKAPLQAVVSSLAEECLDFEPSFAWKYSLCHDILAGVIEVASGERFGDYLASHIFAPIGASSPTFRLTPTVKEKMAAQYSFSLQEESSSLDLVDMQTQTPDKDGSWKNIGKENAMPFGTDYESGGSGLLSTVPDYALLADALAMGGLAHNGNRILKSETVKMLYENQFSPDLLPSFNWSHLKGYGYGLGVRTLLNPNEADALSGVGEFGWGGAAGATLLSDPQSGLSYFYAHHMLNPQEAYYQPRLRNAVFADFKSLLL